jgi:D-threo-aldose 1-dehydrogenase
VNPGGLTARMTDPAPAVDSEVSPPDSSAHPDSQQTALGFGCAGLYHLPSKRDRFAILDAAYDLGIRHFDVAPIYGFGQAEVEIGKFRVNHPDIEVATKFGISSSMIGRVAGRVQPMVRSLLQRYPVMQRRVKASGSGPDSGLVGRVLYSGREFSRVDAERALTRCRRILGSERIDYFLLHEPAGALLDDWPSVVEYLEGERGKGGIGRWGLAGDLTDIDGKATELVSRATVLQYPYDCLTGYCGPQPDRSRVSITFGFIARPLPRIAEFLAQRPVLRVACSEALDADLSDRRTLIRLLVRDAVEHNRSGVVLISSTSSEHLAETCAAASAPFSNGVEVASMIRQAMRGESTPQ